MLHLNAGLVDPIEISTRVCQPPCCLGRPGGCSCYAGSMAESSTGSSKVASRRLLFPSACSNRARLSSEGCQPSAHPATTFQSLVLAVLGTTVLTQAVDVDRKSCAGGSAPIMRHRPLSRRRSAIERDDSGLASGGGHFVRTHRQRSWDWSDPSQP